MSRALPAICSLLIANAVAAQPADLTARPPALDSLEFFVGTWTIDAPGASYRQTCGWVGDRRHVVCNGRQEGPGGSYDDTTVFTYARADSTLRSYFFAGRGDPEMWMGRVEGEGFVFWVEAGTESFPAVRRMAITPTENGYELVGEESRGGGPWVELARYETLRVE